MFLLANNGVVVFDTPGDTKQFQQLLDSIKLKQKQNQNIIMCIATHWHDSEVLSNHHLRQARTR